MKFSKMKSSSRKANSVLETKKIPNLKTHSEKKNVKVKKASKSRSARLRSTPNNDLARMSVDDFFSVKFSDSDDGDSENDESLEERVSNGVGARPRPLQKTVLSKPSKRKNKSSFIDFEAEEGKVELENDSLIEEECEDDQEGSEDVNVHSFLDSESKEDNHFDSDEDDELDDENKDVSNDDDDDKDYADVPGGEDDDDKEDEDGLTPSAHKMSLQRLRATDPEFYKFLEVNDKKLLQFQISDSEDDQEQTDKFHKPIEELEVASDESDFEAEDKDEDTDKKEGVISLKMVRVWQGELQTDKSVETIANVIQAFHAALNRVTGEEGASKYKVDGSSVFNAIVQLCVLELQPAIKRFLRMPTAAGKNVLPHKCKKWNKVKSLLKSYLQDLLKLMGGVSSPHVVSVLLKHLHQMAPFITCFPNIIQKVLKRLTSIWGSGEETSRIVSFLCILRLCTNQKSLLDSVLKQMYLTYVSNAKFVSPNTLPGINFMRRSLVEVYRLDEMASYQHVFLYVRQLAIHLRNAITLQKKESMQAVLNWQFVHSLHLWAELLGATANHPALQPLLYPLVQVIIGTIKLIPTTQYFPLRFHCVQMLIDLSNNTNTFIPVLPFLLELLTTYDFNKRHKKASMKPMDMTCLLRVSKAEQAENSFKDAVLEQIYRQLLQCLANDAHSIGFPDLVVTAAIQIKKFLKECKVANYCKKIKSILDKMDENARFVEKERKLITLNLQDRKAIDAFETNLKLKGTPLGIYYANFQKVNKQVMKKRATDSDKLGDFDLPSLVKRKRKPEEDGPAVLFPSDSDSEADNFGSDDQEEKQKKKRRKKVKKPKSAMQTETSMSVKDNQPDIIQDLRLEDF